MNQSRISAIQKRANELSEKVGQPILFIVTPLEYIEDDGHDDNIFEIDVAQGKVEVMESDATTNVLYCFS